MKIIYYFRKDVLGLYFVRNEIEFCCDELKKAVDDDYIICDRPWSFYQIPTPECYGLFVGNVYEDFLIKIRYCPFCGKKVIYLFCFTIPCKCVDGLQIYLEDTEFNDHDFVYVCKKCNSEYKFKNVNEIMDYAI